MAKQKLSFDEALQAINDQTGIRADDVQACAMRRPVWVAEWHFPGCLSDSFRVTTDKRNAIAIALEIASGEAGPPRGMATDLRRFGRSERTAPDAWAKGAITTVSRQLLRDCF